MKEFEEPLTFIDGGLRAHNTCSDGSGYKNECFSGSENFNWCTPGSESGNSCDKGYEIPPFIL